MSEKNKVKQSEIIPDDNPNKLTDQDDLHEIQVSDDLNEPDPEAEYPPTLPDKTEIQSEN